jgi:DNA-binding CsgD family transcriptional regulator
LKASSTVIELTRATRGQRALSTQSRFEAVSEAETAVGLADALTAAAECIGFSSAQAMLLVPNLQPQPTTLVLQDSSEKVLRFDRAVAVGQDLISGYDLGLGDPNQDPVMLKFRSSSIPVLWSGDTYIDAGMGDMRDWWVEYDREHGVTLSIPLSVDEFSKPLAILVSVQRREPIRQEDHARVSADVALLGLHAAIGGNRALTPLLLSAKRASSPLTAAMRQYLLWAERGKTAAETADIVGRKYSTIKNVLAQAMERMGCSNKADAIRVARANGWL